MQLPLDARENKGFLIAEKNEGLRRIDANTYSVKSQSGHGDYTVHSGELGWICECPDHLYRASKCKHIWSVEFSLKMRMSVINQVVIQGLNMKACIFCGSEHIIKRGIRENQSGSLQRYLCKTCGKRFSFNLGFEKMKATPQVISSAMQLYFTGESLRNVRKFLRLQGVKVSHVSVYNWINKYIALMKKHLDKIQPKVSEETWRADEIYIKVKGDMKYVFALMDDETRFWIAQEIASTKYTHDASYLFRSAKIKTGIARPNRLVTDGLPAYHDAYLKEFWTNTMPRTIHESSIHLHGNMQNNTMERMNGEIRDREKTFRGIKKEESPIFNGYQIFHNYIRTHEGLKGITPAEAANIKVQGENKWITIIQDASRKDPMLNKPFQDLKS